MTPIDLIPFAEHSQKLPESFLVPEAQKKDKWSVFAAHMIDFGIAWSLMTMITLTVTHAFDFMMVTKSLKMAYSTDFLFNFSNLFLPLFVFSYFFFAYFLNHGQTPGLHLMKRRVELQHNSFRDAARWAAWSMLLCFSWGLSYFVKRDLIENFKGHDWLYKKLIEHKESYSIDLFDRIKEPEVAEVQEDWAQAA